MAPGLRPIRYADSGRGASPHGLGLLGPARHEQAEPVAAETRIVPRRQPRPAQPRVYSTPARFASVPMRIVPSNPTMQYGMMETGCLPPAIRLLTRAEPMARAKPPTQPDRAPDQRPEPHRAAAAAQDLLGLVQAHGRIRVDGAGTATPRTCRSAASSVLAPREDGQHAAGAPRDVRRPAARRAARPRASRQSRDWSALTSARATVGTVFVKPKNQKRNHAKAPSVMLISSHCGDVGQPVVRQEIVRERPGDDDQPLQPHADVDEDRRRRTGAARLRRTCLKRNASGASTFSTSSAQ